VTRAFPTFPRPLCAALEILHSAFVLLGSRTSFERAKVAPFAGFWVQLARIQAISAGFEFPNHGVSAAPLRVARLLSTASRQ
jgi:hypothetical protein